MDGSQGESQGESRGQSLSGPLAEPLVEFPATAGENGQNAAPNALESAASRWHKLAEIARISNPWLTLIGERLRDGGGQIRDYWRTEVDDALIVVVEGDGMLWLPAPQYRPGVDKQTLDFAGGRCPRDWGERAHDASQRARAEAILARELDIEREGLKALEPLIETPLAVNSSTSNQRLWGWLAQLKSGVRPGGADARSFTCDAAGLARLHAALDCLQCRVLLLEYERRTVRC